MCGAAVQPLEVIFLKRTLCTARILSIQAPCDTPEKCARIPSYWSRIMHETQLTHCFWTTFATACALGVDDRKSCGWRCIVDNLMTA